MVDLGLRQQRGPVTLAGISRRQQISLSYLEQMFAKLRRHGLVVSTRGPGGGYRLAKVAEAITAAGIIYAVDRSEPPTGNGNQNADNNQSCNTSELWASLDRRMIEFLDTITLQDMITQQKARGLKVEPQTHVREREVIT
jgi:Rrf2 family iron-sulfur cluster assembly transcriptional regulator